MAAGAHRPLSNLFGAGHAAVARRGPLDAVEVGEVMDWRARHGGGWQAAADFAGRSEHDVRMACDMAYRRRHS